MKILQHSLYFQNNAEIKDQLIYLITVSLNELCSGCLQPHPNAEKETQEKEHHRTWNNCAIKLESFLMCCWKAPGFAADPSGLKLSALLEALKYIYRPIKCMRSIKGIVKIVHNIINNNVTENYCKRWMVLVNNEWLKYT